MTQGNYRVIGHYEVNGKLLTGFGSGLQFLMSGVNQFNAPDGAERPDPAAIAAKVASRLPAGAVFVVDGVSLLDKETNPPGML